MADESAPRGTVPASIDPNFDPLGPWRQKVAGLSDDGAKAKSDSVIAAVDAMIGKIQTQKGDIAASINSSQLSIPSLDPVAVGNWVKASEPLYAAYWQADALVRLLSNYRASVATWQFNHDLYRTSGVTPPPMPQPSGDLLIYMPGLVF